MKSFAAAPHLALLFAFVADGAAAQAYSWVLSPLNGHYYAITGQMNWTQAEAEAQLFQGHLATVRSQAENDWIANNFGAISECLWIGFNDLAVPNTFTWASGEPIAFTNWDTGQPDNGNGSESCTHLRVPWVPGPSLFKWNDLPDVPVYYHQVGNTSTPYVCRGVIETLQPPPAPTFQVFGVGCAGSNGTPNIAAAPGSLPRIGQQFTVRLTSIPVTGFFVIAIPIIGFDATFSGGNPLPRDLGFLGMPGCTQYLDPSQTAFLFTPSGTLDWIIAIPYLPAFIGVPLYLQAGVVDLPANPLGITLSNAAIATLGW